MKYTYSTTKEQWKEHQLILMQRAFEKKKPRKFEIAIIVLLVIIYTYEIIKHLIHFNDYTITICILSFLVIVLLAKPIIEKNYFPKKRWLLYFDRVLEKNPELFQVMETTFEIKDGVLFFEESNGTKRIYPLKTLYKIEETTLSILIYLNSSIVELMPKSLFASNDEMKDFMDTINKAINESKTSQK